MGEFNLVTGPGTQCYINGNLVGEVRGIKFISQTMKRAIYGIDSGIAYELAPTITKVSGTITMYRKVGLGGLEGLGVVSNFENTEREQYVSIRVIQRQTQTLVFQCETAAIISQEWEVAARQIMTGSFSFEGLTWNNEIKE